MFYASFDGKWTAQATVPNSSTVASPALAAFQGRLYDAWAGRVTDKLRMGSGGGEGSRHRPFGIMNVNF